MIIMIWYYHVWLWVKLQPQHIIVSGSTAQGPGFCVPTEMWGDPCLHILDPVATHDHTGTVLSSQEDDEIVAMLVAISWCKDPMKQDAELTISHGAHWVSICFHWTSSHSSLETRSGAVAWSDQARCFEAIVALWIFVGCSPCGISLFKGGGGRRWWSFKGASKDPEICADARFGLSSFQNWQCYNLAPKTWSVNWTGRVHSSLMDA